MKICVWKTGHEIADTIARVAHESLPGSILKQTSDVSERAIDEAEIHICYGILRGADQVFRLAEKAGKPWFNIDKGYWKPGHYEGYYRVSLRGTQQTFGFDRLEPDYDRWDETDQIIWERAPTFYRHIKLVCPPTDYVRDFYYQDRWEIFNAGNTPDYFYRTKLCNRLLNDDLNRSKEVITFNSSVGWEALRQGIPVTSDPTHSIVGAYQKLIDKPLHLDFNERRKLFAIMASLQLTLSEMRSGQLWPLLQKLLGSTSDMTGAKQLPRTWQRIASQGAQTPQSTSNS